MSKRVIVFDGIMVLNLVAFHARWCKIFSDKKRSDDVSTQESLHVWTNRSGDGKKEVLTKQIVFSLEI